MHTLLNRFTGPIVYEKRRLTFAKSFPPTLKTKCRDCLFVMLAGSEIERIGSPVGKLENTIQMHELSIALSILDMVALEAIKKRANEVREIELEVGLLSGVDIPALEFSLQAARRFSPFERAQVRIVEVAPLSRCRLCGRNFLPAKETDNCPFCRSVDTELLQGRELRLKSILAD